MIRFNEIIIDDNKLSKIASDSFLKCANNILADDAKNFRECFEGYPLSDLKTVVFKIHYTKYLDNKFIGFDGSTMFHFEIHMHVFAYDEDEEAEQLAVYRLILNENLEIVDDFLVTT